MQSNRAKALVAVGSIALIVVLFVVLSGADEESPPSAAGTSAATTDGPEGDGGDGAGAKAGKPAGEDEPVAPEIVVSNGAPEGGVAEFAFEKGAEVRFSVESDVAEEVHVHGYDIYGDLEPGKPTEFAFPAEIDGVFEVELHGTGAVLAELTVKP